MRKTKVLNDELYISMFGTLRDKQMLGKMPSEIWEKIISDDEILRDAIKVTKNKWNEDCFNANCIANMMLWSYKDINEEIYQELVNKVLSNRKLSSINYNIYRCLEGAISNHNLKLTEEQKNFCISLIPQFEGGVFDIRYYILRNISWSEKEKKEILNKYYSEDEYDEALDQWKWAIINDLCPNLDNPLDICSLFDYTKEDISKIYPESSESIIDMIMEEIEFCKLMHKLRPASYETSFQKTK